MRSLRDVTFAVLLAGVLLLTSCGDFFVSRNAINTVAVTPAGILMKAGETTTFAETATTVGGGTSTETPTWSTSNNNIASVDDTGKVTAGTSGGVGVITAKVGGVSGSGAALVYTATEPTGITVAATNNQTTFNIGNNVQFRASITLNGVPNVDVTNYVTWDSDDTAVATVSSTGVVTGVAVCPNISTFASCPKINAKLNATSSGTAISGSLQIVSIPQ